MSVDFSSWPREQEQSFVVYEQKAQESSRKALTIGGIVAGIWFIVMIGIYFGVAPEHKDLTKGMNMENLTKKSKAKEPAAAAPDPKPAAESKPAEAPADDKAEEKSEE